MTSPPRSDGEGETLIHESSCASHIGHLYPCNCGVAVEEHYRTVRLSDQPPRSDAQRRTDAEGALALKYVALPTPFRQACEDVLYLLDQAERRERVVEAARRIADTPIGDNSLLGGPGDLDAVAVPRQSIRRLRAALADLDAIERLERMADKP